MSDRLSDWTDTPTSDVPDEDAGGLFARRGKLIIAAAVMLGALGYFAVMAFQSATVYSYTVSELNALGPTPQGKIVRVNGSLIGDTFRRADGSTLAHFTLTDDAESVAAQYDGVLPDLFFNPHSEIILEGAYGADGVFVSQNVLVKCPSKYVELDDEDAQTTAAEYGAQTATDYGAQTATDYGAQTQ